jgi:hypothetical protein
LKQLRTEILQQTLKTAVGRFHAVLMTLEMFASLGEKHPRPANAIRDSAHARRDSKFTARSAGESEGECETPLGTARCRSPYFVTHARSIKPGRRLAGEVEARHAVRPK